jgi:hypothetical protein
MGIKDLIKSFGSKQRNMKTLIRNLDEQNRAETIVENRKMSSNERELLRFQNEEREEQIKEALEFERIKRKNNIDFAHNPLDVPNITNHTDFEVLKQKNIFSGNRNMFVNQPSVLKGNPEMFKTNRQLMENGNVLRDNGGWI